MIARKKILLFALPAIVLVAAISLQVAGAFTYDDRMTGPHAADVLPSTLTGWLVKDHPVAESQEVKTAVNELLNYDEAILREYRHGSDQFTVYLAHWRPGKMSPRLVAGHTPDECWPDAGWIRQSEAESVMTAEGKLEAEQVRAMQASIGVIPGQFRVYELRGTVLHLLFWHIYGDEILTNEGRRAPPWYAMFTDVGKHGLNQRREQWFVRISSSVPLSALAKDPGFKEVLSRLTATGIASSPPAPIAK